MINDLPKEIYLVESAQTQEGESLLENLDFLWFSKEDVESNPEEFSKFRKFRFEFKAEE